MRLRFLETSQRSAANSRPVEQGHRCSRIAFGLLLTMSALSSAIVPAPAKADPARRIYVGVYLHDVARLAVRDGVYDVDFELWAKWRGEFDHDELQIANAARVETTFSSARTATATGIRHAGACAERCAASSRCSVSRSTPSESLLSWELPERHGRLVPDAAGSGMAERFSLTDWLYEPEFHPETRRRRVASDLGLLENEGAPSTIHHVAYTVMIHRPIITVALKLFLPLGIIVLVALVALFLPGETVAPRSSIGVTALLSCFAFQFTVADSLPAVSYITLADTLFLIAYLLSTLGLVITIVSHSFFRQGRLTRSAWTDRFGRLLLPIAATASVWAAIPEPAPVQSVSEEPFPQMERTRSSRDVLRIGVRSLNSLLSSPVFRGTYWSLMKSRRGREPDLVFIQRRPGVDNELVRFLANGQLEVTWKLRDNIRWSDGRPLNNEDLILPWEAHDDPNVIEASAPDDQTLVVRWSGRLAAALESPSPWPSHVLEPLYEEGGYDAAHQHRREHPVPVLGPYRVNEFERGERLVAEANEHFPGPPPAIRRVEVRRYESGEAIIEAFSDEQIDIAYPNAVSMDEALVFARDHPRAIRIRPSPFFIFLEPDMNHPLLSKLAVRRAILMGIDRERLASEVYQHAGRVAHVAVPEHTVPGLVVTEHDPDAAVLALERARVGEVTIPLLHTASAVDRQIVGLIAEDLQDIGITLEPREIRSSARVSREKNHGGLLLHIIRGDLDASPGRYWNLPIEQGSYARDVRHDAYTDAVHALVERERRALYGERRDQLRDALLALTSERLPNIPLVFAAQRILAHPDLRGWDQGASERFGERLEQWYFAAR